MKTFLLEYANFQLRGYISPNDLLSIIPGIGSATSTLVLPDTNGRVTVDKASVLIGHFLLDTTNDGSDSFQRVRYCL